MDITSPFRSNEKNSSLSLFSETSSCYFIKACFQSFVILIGLNQLNGGIKDIATSNQRGYKAIFLYSNKRFRQAILVFVLIAIPSFAITGSYIVSDSPTPKDGVEENPYPSKQFSDGFLFIVIDGGGRNMMANPDLMPKLNERVEDGAYLELVSSPMTMTAICVKEIATGVPSKPNEALSNFRPEHPGTLDGWKLASTHDGDNDGEYDHKVGILGDYVWKDLYPDRDLIPFSQHRYGHADYYQGDEESFVTLESWLSGEIPKGHDRTPNIIVAHLSGLDSVGHRYGVKDSPEFEDKLSWLDDKMDIIFEMVPENWTVLVTADHGLTDLGQHGSPEPVIRETAGFMWGPNIAGGVTVEDMTQRDLATLPSMIFGLPLPHAIHGKVPLDAFVLTDQEYQAYEQWNWDAAVERNDWLEENGHSYIKDMSKDKIEWDLVRGDEIGMRNIDLWVSAIAVIAFTSFLYWFLKSREDTERYAIVASLGFLAIISFSALQSYNRDTFARYYYFFGLVGFLLVYWMLKESFSKEPSRFESRALFGLTSVFFVAASMYYMLILMALIGLFWATRGHTRSKISDDEVWVGALLASLIFTIVYPETRFTILALPIWIGLLMLLENRMFVDESTNSPKRVMIPFILILIATIFFSDYRVYGVSATRFMVMFTQSSELDSMLWSVVIAFTFALIYATRMRKENWPVALAIAGTFATIPVLIAQESNTVDWILIYTLIAGVVASGILRLSGKQHAYPLFQYCAFAWMTMSWGAWGGGISMIFFAAIESLMNKEWSHLNRKRDSKTAELARNILVGILPIGLWFAWWATLGQTDGLLHPRDIDPGNLFLKGGYIGDRLSPSNTWVFIMGAGPAILMGVLLWNVFRLNKWPLQMTVIILAVRLAAISLQLSISPNLPRLVFKIGWDILFCVILLTVSGIFMLYEQRINKEKVYTTEA